MQTTPPAPSGPARYSHQQKTEGEGEGRRRGGGGKEEGFEHLITTSLPQKIPSKGPTHHFDCKLVYIWLQVLLKQPQVVLHTLDLAHDLVGPPLLAQHAEVVFQALLGAWHPLNDARGQKLVQLGSFSKGSE